MPPAPMMATALTAAVTMVLRVLRMLMLPGWVRADGMTRRRPPPGLAESSMLRDFPHQLPVIEADPDPPLGSILGESHLDVVGLGAVDLGRVPGCGRVG